MNGVNLHVETQIYGVEYKGKSYRVEVINDYIYGQTEYIVTISNNSLNVSEKQKDAVIKYLQTQI